MTAAKSDDKYSDDHEGDAVGIYEANCVTDDGTKIVGLHTRPMIAHAHAKALQAVAMHFYECGRINEEAK